MGSRAGHAPSGWATVIFEPTPIELLFVVRPTRHADDRGFFARLWCEQDFADAGHPLHPTQISTSFNHRRGTLRGLHWQTTPYAETKLVRPVRGRIFDVAIDLRSGSPTWGGWFGIELDAIEGIGLLIPPDFAHGFLTLSDDTEVLYLIDMPHHPEAARGARWDDPQLAIDWPFPPAVISERDCAWPLLQRPEPNG